MKVGETPGNGEESPTFREEPICGGSEAPYQSLEEIFGIWIYSPLYRLCQKMNVLLGVLSNKYKERYWYILLKNIKNGIKSGK